MKPVGCFFEAAIHDKGFEGEYVEEDEEEGGGEKEDEEEEEEGEDEEEEEEEEVEEEEAAMVGGEMEADEDEDIAKLKEGGFLFLYLIKGGDVRKYKRDKRGRGTKAKRCLSNWMD